MSKGPELMNRFSFFFEGERISASEGDSVAAALLNSGKYSLGERLNGKERGLYCGMGVCNECLVNINGERGLRSCMESAEPNAVVQREIDTRWTGTQRKVKHPKRLSLEVDIIIVGAGPAGLNAAIEAANYGANIVVIDEREESGGQYYKPRTKGFRGKTKEDRQHLEGLKLRARAHESKVKFFTGQTVWYARKENGIFELRCSSKEQQVQLFSSALILCTGAFEIPTVVPGWTLPGVTTIGAAQTMVRRYGVVPKGRGLIAGNGPLGLQLVHEMIKLGKNQITLAERANFKSGSALFKTAFYSPQLFLKGVGYRLSAMKSRVPVMSGWEIEKVLGNDKVEAALIRNIKSNSKLELPVDFIAAGEGFAPQSELSRLLGVPTKVDPVSKQIIPIRADDCSTSISNLWIAGDAGGMGGAELAEIQGKIAAHGALKNLSYEISGKELNSRSLSYKRVKNFQAALWSLYRAPVRDLPKENFIICRCEQVSLQHLKNAINCGAHDLGSIKRETRLAMGRCQGRYCIPQAIKHLEKRNLFIDGDGLFAPQIPARPISARAIWLEKPEWKGHKETSLPSRPQALSKKPLSKTSADLVVIGGGVTGISASYFAAKEGASVICIDKGHVNSEASGGNAGSLHLQLLSWDFGSKAVGDGQLQLGTLPLQKESINLWGSLQDQFNTDFEMEFTGGLMVAENSDQVKFLEQKIKAEAGVGIQTNLIGKDQIAKIVPEISGSVIAGSWCKEEGKINPLIATPILAREAKSQGAVIEELTQVIGLSKESHGYEVLTNRGSITAKRVIVAAGGWSSKVFAMLNICIPIKGAPLQMIVTSPAPKIVTCLMYHAGRHLTLKQSKAGSIIIGGAWPANVSPEGRSEVLPESIEGNLWAAGQTIPSIGDVPVLRTWGAMNIDIDGAPVIGEIPGYPGLIVAATANGYTLGPLMGQQAANSVLSGYLRQDLEMFSVKRFN